MALKLLPALRENRDYWERIALAIRRHLLETVFKPLLAEMGDDANAYNSLEELCLAIAQGRIQYTKGHFEGRFSAAISRELKKQGAVFDRHNGWWAIPSSKLPIDLRIAIGTSYSRFKEMADRLNRKLWELKPEEIAKQLNLSKLFEHSIFMMDKQFSENVSKIGIVPKLTADVKEQIARDYSDNTKLDIKKFTEKEIEKLRAQVQKNTFDYGLRRESMVESIRKQYGVTDRKAKFLARQETSLLMSAFQKGRCLDAGLPRYKWKCVNMPPGSGPHSVRPDHWDLDGTIQFWDNPPIVDRQTGKRANPKQDYNCRCTAIPIIE